jgi:hypothetical protein
VDVAPIPAKGMDWRLAPPVVLMRIAWGDESVPVSSLIVTNCPGVVVVEM